MDVLKRINQLRLERNWSIYRLSVKSGIPQSTMTNMFNRGTLPSITTLELICDAFDITLAEFFTDPISESVSVPTEVEFASMYTKLPDTMKRTVCDLMREYLKK